MWEIWDKSHGSWGLKSLILGNLYAKKILKTRLQDNTNSSPKRSTQWTSFLIGIGPRPFPRKRTQNRKIARYLGFLMPNQYSIDNSLLGFPNWLKNCLELWPINLCRKMGMYTNFGHNLDNYQYFQTGPNLCKFIQ